VPLRGENRRIVREGLVELSRTRKPGLLALMEVAALEPGEVSEQALGFRLGPRINAAGRMQRADAALELMMTDSPERAAEVARELDLLNLDRREAETSIRFAADAACADQAHQAAIVVAGEGWHAGVVGIVAPEASSLLGLVSRLAPAVVSGNSSVVLASETRPLPAVTLGEVLATSDVSGGVINLLTGYRGELIPWLAAHMDVNALDTWGVPLDLRAATEESAVENVKRLARPPRGDPERFDWMDDRRAQRPEWIAAYLEMKTVWHPIGV